MSGNIIVCLPKMLPRSQWEIAANTASEINPANHFPVERLAMIMPGFKPTPEHLAVIIKKYWGSGGVCLTVGFLDSPPADLRARILAHMNAWNQTANVQFVETMTDPQVRIARLDSGPNSGYWSYVGTDILHIAPGEPTMNLDSFTMHTGESEFHRVVRHETGHTLGFPHEHMRRELVDLIDPAKAIAYFDETQGWDPEMVRQQVLTPLEEASLWNTDHADPNSIMCYQIPGSITKNGQPILGGLDIDALDYAFVAQIYPKIWPNGHRINDIDSTPQALTTCIFQNKLYLFWRSNDPSGRIFYSVSSDGSTWSHGKTINSLDTTPEAVSACVFQNKLYLFWRSNDPSGRIFYSVSSDGSTWPHGKTINSLDTTSKAPATCVFQNKLYLFWKSNDSGNRILSTVSSDGSTWPYGKQINSVDTTPEAVNACVFQNKLYLFWKSNDPSGRILCSVSTDGSTWPYGKQINKLDSTPKAVSACVFQSNLYLFWKSNDSGNRILSSVSTDGSTWSYGKQINSVDTTPQPLATCAFNNQFYVFWKANDPGNRIYGSVNNMAH